MSGVVDQGTAESIESGRESLGAILSTAQQELQKVFLVFVTGFLLTFYALRIWVWDWLKAVTVSQMDPDIAEQTEIIVTTPFEVILLQAKIGIMIGILISLPVLVYLSRRELKERGRWPEIGMSRGKQITVGTLSVALFVGGTVYAYEVFFPIMFDFLASQAIGVGVAPTYGIVDWTEFLILLTLSFGLAAQLPLMMTGLSYAGIVQYETFRDKWKYAIIGIFCFGALFSPPDPFTLMMWAVPLIALYGISLALTKVATNIRRAGDAKDVALGPEAGLRRKLVAMFALGVSAGLGVPAFVYYGGPTYLWTEVRPSLPAAIRPSEPLGLSAYVAARGTIALVEIGLVAVVAVLIVPGLLYLLDVLRRPVHPPLNPSDPTAVDLRPVSLEQLEAMPDDVFRAMDEETAVEYASDAIAADERAKASRILDRFDAVHEEADESEQPPDEDAEAQSTGEVVQDTATGMMSAFTDEQDEDDIGGYIHDIRFIADSLRSRMFHMFIVFAVVLAAVFTFLYQGGLGYIKDDFVGRMPAAVRPEEMTIIALHPVEVLIFIVKVSTILGAFTVVPMILYYAWPSMQELGWVGERRDVIFKWTAGTVLALIGGTVLGYFVIAPGIISYLVYDALQAGMIISYRINSFAWLIIFTTVGVGLLAIIPYTMWMLYLGGIASYGAMRDRWREVTIAAFVLAGMFTPATVLTMFIVGIPVMIFYWVGLAGLWLATLGGRRGRYVRPQTT